MDLKFFFFVVKLLPTNLEESLAALARAHAVMLARGVVPAHRAQPLGAQPPPAGAGARLVLHEAVRQLQVRVRKARLQRRRAPVQLQRLRVQLRVELRLTRQSRTSVGRVLEGKQGKSRERVLPVQVVLPEAVQGAGLVPDVSRWSLEVGGRGVRGGGAVEVDGARGGRQLLRLLLRRLEVRTAVRLLHLYARRLSLQRHLEEAGGLHVVAGGVRSVRQGPEGGTGRGG